MYPTRTLIPSFCRYEIGVEDTPEAKYIAEAQGSIDLLTSARELINIQEKGDSDPKLLEHFISARVKCVQHNVLVYRAIWRNGVVVVAYFSSSMVAAANG